MEKSQKLRAGRQCLFLMFALAYGVGTVIWIGGRNLGSGYPYHMWQADALLHGRLSLSHSISDLRPGLAWYNGHVQQVWGLGVPIYLVPIQALWKLFAQGVCPERVGVILAFTLLALYVVNTGSNLAKSGTALGVGFIWLILLCPPLLTLLRTSEMVFEKTVLYAILLSLGIVVALTRFVIFRRRMDFFVCCIFAAFSPLVRPTHGIYGLAAVMLCSALLLHKRAVILTGFGISIFLPGLTLLAMTNYARFGSATEFGHRLTVTTADMAYLTRFGNPFANASGFQASKELAGLLFLSTDVHDANAFSANLFPGQAKRTRWRRLSFTTFDTTYCLPILFALWTTLSELTRQRNPSSGVIRSTASLLLVWSCPSGLALVGFYLRFPIITSRYLLDFTPTLVGAAIAAWLFISPHFPRIGSILLAGWTLFEFASAKIPIAGRTSLGTPRVALHAASGPETIIQKFHGIYTVDVHPAETQIPFNGSGWEWQSGFAEPVVTLAIREPTFVEICVTPRREHNGEPAKEDVYRAMIDGYTLPTRSVNDMEYGKRILFEVPEHLKKQNGIKLLFLCFVDEYEAEDRESERILQSVKWQVENTADATQR